MSAGRRISQRAELRVYGTSDGVDFEPNELTRLLGIEPTLVSRRGDRLRSGRVQPCTVWWWQSDEREEVDSEVLVKSVLDTFEPVSDAVTEAAAQWSLDLVVGVVINQYGVLQSEEDGTIWADVPTPALSFSRDTLTRLSRLNCHLDFDQYVTAPDDEEPDC